MSDVLHYDSIHIVESLRPGDLKTGEALADRLRYGAYGVAVHLRRPASKHEFLEYLSGIAAEARNGHHSPIVHIEAHGNANGIEVASGEFVSWRAMKTALTEINTASGLNLLVVMAACCGGNLVKIVEPADRAPVWALIGPNRDLLADDIAADFPGFYDEFLGSHDGRRALERLNGAALGQPWRYAFVPARYFFRIVFGGYVRQFGTPEMLRQREDTLVRGIVGTRPEPYGLRQALGADLANHEAQFRRLHRLFFMTDLFPENEKRFPVTLADCLRDPADDPDEPPASDESVGW